jgi:7-cyano-7-deazaguanine synthase in queuosine biosynthesis
MDSLLLIAWLLNKGYDVWPLVFDDGSINFNHRRMPAIEKCLQHYSMYDKMQHIRLYHFEPMRKNDLFGFIPGWKMAIQVSGMAYCQHLGINEMYLGYNADNLVGGYKDELQSLIDKQSEVYREMYDWDIKVISPFFKLQKWEMVVKGTILNVPYEYTNSCRQIQHMGLVHCGKCEVCYRRKESFAEAAKNHPEMNIVDPTLWWHEGPRPGPKPDLHVLDNK